MRRSMACVAAAMVTGVLAGCVGGWSEPKFERDAEAVFLLPAGAGLDIETANGAIEVTETQRDDVLVRAKIRAMTQERADAVVLEASSASGDLEVRAVWPEGRMPSEGVSMVVEAPGGRAVAARTQNGAVTVTGFAGGAAVRTSNGRIEVQGHDGPVRAETSNGRVQVVEASGAVTVRTSNGRVLVELADASAGPVSIDTSNGAVELRAGPAFAGVLEARTSNGSISVEDSCEAGAVRTLDSRDQYRLLSVRAQEDSASATPSSEVRTSNGSVRVRLDD